MVGCKVFVRWLPVVAQGLRREWRVLLQLKNLACFLSLDSMHCLSLGVVFLIIGPPQTSYFVVDNYISFKDRQEDVIHH